MPKKLSKTNTSISSTATTSTSSSHPSGAPSLPKILADDLPLPRLIIFDLDYTLWPFWVDTHVTPPVKVVNAQHSVCTDKIGDTYSFYPEVPSILYTLGLVVSGVRLGIASRTNAPELAREMLKLLHVSPPPPPPSSSSSPSSALPPTAEGTAGGGGAGAGDGKKMTATTSTRDKKMMKPRRAVELFDAGLELYPSNKIRHMEALAKKTGIPYSEMLFLDDESRNRDVETLGVTMWLVRDGVTWKEVENGVKEWRARRGIR